MTAGASGTASYDWRFDSGRLCLDLMATAEAEPGEGEPLAGAGRLGRWLTGAGLVPAGTPLGEADARQVERFVELRGALSQLIRAEIDDRYAESALERVNALAAADAPPAPEPSGAPTARSYGPSARHPTAPPCSPRSHATPWSC